MTDSRGEAFRQKRCDDVSAAALCLSAGRAYASRTAVFAVPDTGGTPSAGPARRFPDPGRRPLTWTVAPPREHGMLANSISGAFAAARRIEPDLGPSRDTSIFTRRASF
jgi:hypothetical protein